MFICLALITTFNLPSTKVFALNTPPQMSSLWADGHKSRVRLIATGTNRLARGWVYAGIQMQLEDGWKTYWRSPGDVGVPPSFDWSGSKNVKSANVLYPAPATYKDAYSTSIGYKKEVILPVRVIARDRTKPIQLKLRFAYGICADMCVPGEANISLVLSPNISFRSAKLTGLLARYRSMVPLRVKSTGKSVKGFSIDKVSVITDGEKPHIEIDTRIPSRLKTPALFVEATNGFYLPSVASITSSNGRTRRFFVDLAKGDPPAELAGKTLKLTLVGNNSGIEYHHKVAASIVAPVTQTVKSTQ